MNELDTRDRRGAHRLQRGPLRSVLPGLLAVAAVAALVVAVLVMRGTAPRDATVAATSTPAGTATTSAPTTAPASPSGAATSTPTGAAQSAQATPAASPTDSSAATPTAPADVKGTAQVVVLNQTRIAGLAGRLAATLRGAGWTVARTGNFSGNVPATTVYYPEGMQAAAQALAADVPGPDRVRPRFGNLATDKLTVVVTSAG